MTKDFKELAEIRKASLTDLNKEISARLADLPVNEQTKDAIKNNIREKAQELKDQELEALQKLIDSYQEQAHILSTNESLAALDLELLQNISANQDSYLADRYRYIETIFYPYAQFTPTSLLNSTEAIEPADNNLTGLYARMNTDVDSYNWG